MNNLFNYDSKFMQTLSAVADYIILNILYLVCSIPIFTIGAAQTGLYSGLRVLQDKEDDSSCAKAFFRGFRNGFKIITPIWLVSTLAVIILGYFAITTYAMQSAGFAGAILPFIMSLVATILAVIYQSMLPLFHAYFSCTAKQLVKNIFLVIMGNPIQSIVTAIMLWLPVLLILFQYAIFLQASILLIFFYYSVALGLSVRVIGKTFKRLSENVNNENEN